MSALRELLVSFGVEVDDHELKHFAEGTLGGAIEALKGFGATMAGVFALREFGEFIAEQIEIGAHIDHTAEKLGLATSELQKFQFAAGQFGVDADQAGHALGFLNKNIGLALTGNKEASETFTKIGTSIKEADGSARPMGDVLEDLADGFKALKSPQEKTAYAMKLFGREGAALVPILSQGREGVAELNKEFDELGGGMREEFIKSSRKAEDSIKGLKLVTQSLKSEIVLALLPGITSMVKYLAHAGASLLQVVRSSDAVKTALMFLGGLGALSLAKVALSFASVASKALGFGTSLLGIVRTIGYFAGIVAIIAALYLLFDDLFTLAEGGDSVIGKLMDKFGMADEKTELINAMKLSFLAVEDAVKGIVKGLDDMLSKLGVNKTAAQIIVTVFADMFKALAHVLILVGALGETIGQLFSDIAGGKGFSADAYADILHKTDVRQRSLWNSPEEMQALAASGQINQQAYGQNLIDTGAATNQAMVPTAGSPTAAHLEQTNSNQITVNLYPGSGGDTKDDLLDAMNEWSKRNNADAANSLHKGAK